MRRRRSLLRSAVATAFALPAVCWAAFAIETRHWIPAAITATLVFLGWLALRLLPEDRRRS